MDVEPPTRQMDVLVSTSGTAHVVTARGDIDMASAPALRTAVARTIESADATGAMVVLDLSGVQFLDSAGLAVLVWAHQAAASRYVVSTFAVQRVLELSGMTQVLDTFASLDAALAAAD